MLLSIVRQWAFVGIIEEGVLPFTIFLLTNSIPFSSRLTLLIIIILNTMRSHTLTRFTLSRNPRTRFCHGRQKTATNTHRGRYRGSVEKEKDEKNLGM